MEADFKLIYKLWYIVEIVIKTDSAKTLTDPGESCGLVRVCALLINHIYPLEERKTSVSDLRPVLRLHERPEASHKGRA